MPLDSLHIVTEETALEEVLDGAAPAEAEIEAAKEDVEPVAEGAAAGEIESIAEEAEAEEAEAEKTGADLKETETEKAEASVEQPETEQEEEAKKQEAETESTEKADAEPTDSDTDTDKFSNGSIVSGTVLNVNFQQAEIDLGEGEIGVLSGRHYSAGLIVDLTGELKAGDEIEAAVLIRADHNNRVVLSRTWARSQQAWKKIMEAKKHSTIIEAVIMEEVKGGFSVVIDDALGFLPSSLVVRSELTKAASQDADSGDAEEALEQPESEAEAASVEQAEETSPAAGRSPGEFAGQVVKCKVIEAKPDKTRYVLSHKAAVRTEQKQKEKERIAGLEKGTIVSGKVVSLEDFGAFVDIGGVRGLLHRTEMAWNHPNEPREILAMGESVFCKIIKINQQKAQVGLSLCFGENPISKVETGQRLIGKVDRLAYAGAIVALEIPDGAADEASAGGVSTDGDETDSKEEGDSESANGEVPESEEAEAGEASEPDEAGESAETESSEPASVNSTASNQPSDIPVAPTSPKCLLHGFVHVSEMSEYPIRRPQRVVLPGDEVAVKVIEVQRKQRRIGLSIIDAVVPDDLDELLPQDEKLPEDEKSSPETDLADVSNDVADDEVAASEETSSSEGEESVDEDDLETAEKESPPQEDSNEDIESSSAKTQDS